MDWSKSTMLERLKWVIANRKDVVVTYRDDETKKVTRGSLNAGTWAMAAGLGRTALYNQMSRMKTEPHRSLTAPTVTALAPVANVSAVWLLNGSGSPEVPTTSTILDERYTVTDLLKAAAKKDGFDEVFVDQFIADLDADDQPSFGELWGVMAAAYARHERKTRAQGNPLAGLDDRPVRNTRKKT